MTTPIPSKTQLIPVQPIIERSKGQFLLGNRGWISIALPPQALRPPRWTTDENVPDRDLALLLAGFRPIRR